MDKKFLIESDDPIRYIGKGIMSGLDDRAYWVTVLPAVPDESFPGTVFAGEAFLVSLDPAKNNDARVDLSTEFIPIDRVGAWLRATFPKARVQEASRTSID